MDGSNIFWVLLWSGVVWAQETLNSAAPPSAADVAQDVLAYQDPLLALLANGGITLPTSLVIVAWLVGNKIGAAIKEWSPVINVNLDDPIRVRLLEPRSPRDE